MLSTLYREPRSTRGMYGTYVPHARMISRESDDWLNAECRIIDVIDGRDRGKVLRCRVGNLM